MAHHLSSLPRSTIAAGLATTALVLGLMVLSIASVDSFIDKSREVSQARMHQTELTALMSTLEDAEDADRGFALTGQGDFLREYEAALANVSVHYDRLEADLSPAQRQRLVALRATIDARLGYLHQGIDLAISDRAGARAFIEAGEGKDLMDRIRADVETLQDNERSTVRSREIGFDRLARVVRVTDIVGGVMTIGIVMGSAWAISWHWHRRIDAERSLQSSNLRLERDVALRTASLAELNDRLQQQARDLEASNRELESFSYSVSHDLRAPLRVIEGLSGILLRKSSAVIDERSRSAIEQVIGNTHRMRHLIDDLLAFSKLGFQEVVRERVDMDQLVANAWAMSTADIPEGRVNFRADPLPPCQGDPKLLRQVFLNVFSNAVKYSRTRPDPVVTITGRQDGGMAAYDVSDNGVGFDMSAAAKLFGVFQRLHADAEFEGTGIGLAICRRIVERHGGTISAESIPNQRTTLHVALPAAEPAA